MASGALARPPARAVGVAAGPGAAFAGRAAVALAPGSAAGDAEALRSGGRLIAGIAAVACSDGVFSSERAGAGGSGTA
jgi:hypothetical protein